MSNLLLTKNQEIEIEKSPIDEHIDNLIDMCIIRKEDKEKQEDIRSILNHCKSEYEMSRKLHDVWTGDKTIDRFIQQYGGVIC